MTLLTKCLLAIYWTVIVAVVLVAAILALPLALATDDDTPSPRR